MPPKNSGPARGGGAAAARALDGAGQSVASQSSGAQTGKAPVQPSPPRSEKSWGGAPRTHSGISEKGKGAASSEKAPSVDELVDELSALVAMHERSPLQLQELRSSLQAVTAKAVAAEKVAAERAAVEKAAAKKEPCGPAPDGAVQLTKARALEKPLVKTAEQLAAEAELAGGARGGGGEGGSAHRGGGRCGGGGAKEGEDRAKI